MVDFCGLFCSKAVLANSEACWKSLHKYSWMLVIHCSDYQRKNLANWKTVDYRRPSLGFLYTAVPVMSTQTLNLKLHLGQGCRPKQLLPN
ncbi:hypothetical protein H5410_023491 [Solanum commersonii]|uniref:Uncharacterized protein n=1 Tax=Solanum commersonii TaxID=4109 RepID=A0A9J5ZHQ4_SOLCO|nr:hypothetical protein H5410_023491 [Solanum commersonii]